MEDKDLEKLPPWKKRLYIIIFRADTFYGRLFDEVLLGLILFSVAVVMIESVTGIREQYSLTLLRTEWIVTLLFLVEYILRIICSPRPGKYIFSFFGIIDLLAILPTLISFLLPGLQPLIVVRALRLLRIYRILKLTQYVRTSQRLVAALKNSFKKILIFMIFVVLLVLLLGSVMYVVEGAQNGFYSIPLSIYWAVITLTTVGYGDIVPVTALGKFIATFIMLLGYSIIAIPTGIVSSEITRERTRAKLNSPICKHCGETDHLSGAAYCNTCGKTL